MALPTTLILEVRTGGSDSNGGGFDPASGGTDYSQQDAAQATGTVTSVTTTVTATTAIFTSAMVGNLITDGTTWKIITAFTSSTIVTVDSAPSWTAATIKVGGAFATRGRAGLLASGAVGFDAIFIKNGTYNDGTTTPNVAGGPMLNQFGTIAQALKITGYGTNRTHDNTDTPPLFNAGGNSVNMFDQNGYVRLHNLNISNNTHTSVQGVRIGGSAVLLSRVKVTSCEYAFNIVNGPAQFENCEAVTCTHGFFYNSPGNGLSYRSCSSRNCTASEPAFTLNQFSKAVDCLALGQAGAGFLCTAANVEMNHCVADGCTGTAGNGFVLGQTNARASNCIAVNNAVRGFNTRNDNSATLNPVGEIALVNCAGNNNTAGNTFPDFVNHLNMFNFVTLSGDPFTSAVGLDYTLNNVAGAGAACQGAGAPASIAGLTGTGAPDIGLLQTVPAAPAAGGVTLGRVFTGL